VFLLERLATLRGAIAPDVTGSAPAGRPHALRPGVRNEKCT